MTPSENAYIKLSDFLKHRSFVDSGGHAKAVIQAGDVRVNGETETRRGRKLRLGDRVEFEAEDEVVEAADLAP